MTLSSAWFVIFAVAAKPVSLQLVHACKTKARSECVTIDVLKPPCELDLTYDYSRELVGLESDEESRAAVEKGDVALAQDLVELEKKTEAFASRLERLEQTHRVTGPWLRIDRAPAGKKLFAYHLLAWSVCDDWSGTPCDHTTDFLVLVSLDEVKRSAWVPVTLDATFEQWDPSRPMQDNKNAESHFGVIVAADRASALAAIDAAIARHACETTALVDPHLVCRDAETAGLPVPKSWHPRGVRMLSDPKKVVAEFSAADLAIDWIQCEPL